MRSLARTPDPAVTAAAARSRPARAEPDARAGRDAERIAARVLERAPAPAGLGDGAPLGAATRADLEARFGRDLGAVRVHSDDDAHEAAKAIGARAFTMGPHVVFAHGAYAPETEAGRRLLAHELAHVMQQDAIPAPDHAAGPAPRQRVPAGRVVQRSPAAFTAIEVIAGLAQTASFAAELHSQSLGGLSYSSSVAHRISDKPQPAAHQWQANCLILNAETSGLASAAFDIHWEGNDFGEIGSARVRVSLPHTTAFTHSSASVAFEALPNLVQPGGDKRTWQMAWEYEGTFDQAGFGYVMFQGGFTIDAFGNFTPVRHEMVDRGALPTEIGGVPIRAPASPFLVVPGVKVERPVPPPPAQPG